MWWHKREEGKKEKETIRFQVTTSDDNPLWRTRTVRKIWLEQCGNERETRLCERINERIIEYSGGQMNRTDPSVNIQNVPGYDKNYSVWRKYSRVSGISNVKTLIRRAIDCVMNSEWLGRSKLFKQERFINRIVDWLKKGRKNASFNGS